MTDANPVLVEFPDRHHAGAALDELRHIGLTAEQMGVITPAGNVAEAQTPNSRIERHAADGAATGVAAGGLIGTLVGAASMSLVPRIGPLLAGGLLVRHGGRRGG